MASDLPPRSASGAVLLVGGCGYIGSVVHARLRKAGCDLDVCDPAGAERGLAFARPYQSLTAQELSRYASIVWFAGHSSVQRAVADPAGALRNNCLELFELARRAPQALLVYASTGSLYSGVAGLAQESSLIVPATNAYDTSKYAFDYIAEHFIGRFIGLRLGTVAGGSPNMRWELFFNAMVRSATLTGRVHLRNATARRSLVFVDDLARLVETLLAAPPPPGFYNVASASDTLGGFARRIAAALAAEVVDEGGSPGYDFGLDTGKLARALPQHAWSDFGEQVKALSRTLRDARHAAH